MQINQLRYFVAAAEEGSLSRASRVVHVAQPALTQQIKNLEHAVGTTLFDRTPSGVTLTAAGGVLLGHARHLLESLERARLDVISTGSELRGEVAIAIPRMISAILAPALLRRLSELHPGVSLRIIEGTTLYCTELVENVRVDLAIGAAGTKSASIRSRNFMRQDLYLVGAVENRFGIPASSDPIPFAEAVTYPLSMIQKPHSLQVELEELARERGYSLNVVYESVLGAVNRHVVFGGLAFSILPHMSFVEKQMLGKVFARRIIEPDLCRHYDVLWPTARKMNEATRAIADLIVNERARWGFDQVSD
ncbi:LysR family transcriptional regulator [Albidovulum sediminicola]|uniref:LysR family transcriptional regulator n=1 Tax=Albidovulum sediminicola TaxID=2984331 RepID=A0ABT2Z6L0_9RHOB|nr:LysR family transcriptional regulator [Defluviimonas sp. WL0075]MCV2866711.1 LysR family transcriptional regulator [Defluviimonas sp. WL0075]